MAIISIGIRKGLVGMNAADVPFDKFCCGVVTLNTAVARNGLTYTRPGYLDLGTDKIELRDIQANAFRYIYYPNLDREHYLVPSEFNKNLLIPTRERALIDYVILQEEYGDEGILIESLQSYLRDYEKDLPELYKVADFFKLNRDTLEYWLNEAREETDMSMG